MPSCEKNNAAFVLLFIWTSSKFRKPAVHGRVFFALLRHVAGANFFSPLRCSVRAFAIHFSDQLPQPGRVAIGQTVNFLLQAAFTDCPYLINRNLRRPSSTLDLQPCPPSRMQFGGKRTDDNCFQTFVHFIRADRNNRPCLAYFAADSRIEISAIYLIPSDVQLFSSSPSETAASKSLQSSPSSAIAL